MNPLPRLFGARPLLWLTPGLVGLGIALTLSWPRGPGGLPSRGNGTEEDPFAVELEQKRLEVIRRIVERQGVVDAVVAGRMDLLQAAARFRHLNDRLPEGGMVAFRAYFPGASDEERLCRQVIHRLRYPGADRDDGPDELAARLEAQLNDLLRRGGLTLPPFPPTPARAAGSAE